MYSSAGGAGSCVAARSDEQLAERARAHRLARRPVAGVEAPLEPDLHEDPGLLDLGDHVVERGEVERDGLLAERGHPGIRRRARAAPRARRSRSRSRARRPAPTSASADRQRPDPVLAATTRARSTSASATATSETTLEREQRPDVERPDPADTDHADAKDSGHRPRA